LHPVDTEQGIASADWMKGASPFGDGQESLRARRDVSARLWCTLPSPVARRTVTNGGASAKSRRTASRRFGSREATELWGLRS